ncbi:hypothetical protein GJAV_G00177160 [Gymnothorax javanicus]|nr:hypothetical protein GJAV_G00177160 [Gymnothorax javanicus]
MTEDKPLSSYASVHLSGHSLHPSVHRSGSPQFTPGSTLPSSLTRRKLLPAMATNRERQVSHMTGFQPAVYPFAFNSIRSHSPFDLLANSSLFGRFGADLPKEMAALCEYIDMVLQRDPLNIECFDSTRDNISV